MAMPAISTTPIATITTKTRRRVSSMSV